MSWVIATLLALILVALMASDKSAAVAVRRVIRVAFVGAVGLGVTLAIALFFVWFHFGFANEDWWQTAPALLVFLTFALFAWTARKEIAAEYRKDRRRALMGVAKLLAYVGLLLVAGYMLKLILEAFQLSGWWLVVAALAGSGLLLLIRTAASPMRWRQVWFGPADVPEPWQVVESARWQAEQEERAIYDKEAETWDDLTSAEQDALWARRNERASAIESHLAAVQQQAEAATASAKAESGEWNMRTVFWLFAALSNVV